MNIKENNMKNNQINEGTGTRTFMSGNSREKFRALAAATTIAGGAALGGYAGHVVAGDPASNPSLAQPLKDPSGEIMRRRSGDPVTPLSQTRALTEPAGALFGAGAGLAAAAAIGNRRRRKSSEPLKEYYKQRLLNSLYESELAVASDADVGISSAITPLLTKNPNQNARRARLTRMVRN